MRLPSYAARFSWLLLAATACGPSGSLSFSHDAAVEAGAAHDLSLGPDLAPPGVRYHYVVDKFLFPQQRSDYAFDLNGDGFPDDQFGNLVKAFAVQGLQVQAADYQAIVAGDALELVSLVTQDPSFLNDPTAVAALYVGNPQHPPDLTGNGSFSIDTTLPTSPMAGALVARTFTSDDPVHLTTPPIATVRLVLVAGPPVDLPLVGVRVTFAPTAANLIRGQLNGALRAQDLNGKLIPALAANLTLVEQRVPCDADCMKVATVFDRDHDGSVDPTELMQSPAVGAYLLPDLRLWSGATWMPDPANTSPRDSWSLGLGFTAIGATFTEP
jgi:hypothetical protein